MFSLLGNILSNAARDQQGITSNRGFIEYFDNTLNPAVQTVLSGETIDTNKIDTAFIKLFATYQKQFK